ncbi:hypothetical protein ACOSP7_016322 [Xanthoceras sorbifolium]
MREQHVSRADVDHMTKSNKEDKKTAAKVSTKALVLENENISLKEEVEKLKGTKSSEWDSDAEILAWETYLMANKGSTNLPTPDLTLSDDEIVDYTEKTTSNVQA